MYLTCRRPVLGWGRPVAARRWLGEAALWLVVLALAAGLRFVDLATTPPGLFGDEAINGMDGLEALHGHPRVFYETNHGREPATVLTTAVGEALLGPSVLGVRVAPATLGVLGVLLTTLIARLWCGATAALATGVAMATAPWHLIMSRVDLENPTAPLACAAVVLTLWWAGRVGNWRAAALAGATLGLSLYTYRVSRAYPVLVVALVAVSWRTSDRWRPSLARAGVYLASATVVFAPLGLFFLAHPQWMLARAGEVAGGPGSGWLPTLGMFLWKGDENWRHNVAGRPVFDPALGALFMFGLLACGLSWRRTVEARWVLLWLALMLVPGAVSAEAPHFGRTGAALPAAFLLVGAGAQWLLSGWRGWAARWRAGRSACGMARLGEGALGLLLTVMAVRGGWLVLHDWGGAPQTFDAFNGATTQAALALAADPAYPRGAPTWAYVVDPDVTAFLLPSTRGRLLDAAGSALPYDEAGGAWYFFAWSRRPTLLEEYGGAVETRHAASSPEHLEGAYAQRSEAVAQRLAGARAVGAAFGNLLRLERAAAPGEVAAGQAFAVDLLWRVMARTEENLGFALRVVDEEGYSWAQSDRQGRMLPPGWPVGQPVLSYHPLRLPSYAPPGRYHLAASAQRRTALQPSAIVAELGKSSTVGDLLVTTSEGEDAPPLAAAMAATFGPLVLLGRGPLPQAATPGQPAYLALFWRRRAADPLPALRLVASDHDGHDVARAGPLARAPAVWAVGHTFQLNVRLDNPAGLPAPLRFRLEGDGQTVELR